MAIARFKDLCIDAVDATTVGRFWAAVLDRDLELLESGASVLNGQTPGHTIWVNVVPEPKMVKNRVHLDVYARRLADLGAIGATVVDTGDGDGRWTVMADPEGNEFCAFLREEIPAERLHGLVVDCADPLREARWWAEAYDADLVEQPQGYATVQQIPGMPVLTMDFVPVPESKTVKNRLHWDVTVGSLEQLAERGARVMRPEGGDRRWHVMADPEGNEFCAFVRD